MSGAVKLSGGGTSVEIFIDGYESDPIPGDVPQPGTTWLVVCGGVVSDGTTRVFGSISLDIDDAVWLGEWMHAVLVGTIVPFATSSTSYPELLRFPEPDLAVQLVGRDSSSVTTRWYFYDASASVKTIGNITYNVRDVDVTVSEQEFDAAAIAWIEDLERFPDR